MWGKKINVIINKREDLSTQMGTHVMLPRLPLMLLPPMLPKLPMLPDFHKREKEPKVFLGRKKRGELDNRKIFSLFTFFELHLVSKARAFNSEEHEPS